MSKKEPIPRRAMTQLEQNACLAINDSVSYLPGSFDKRFARDMEESARQFKPQITENQARHLWRHVWRYRRQLKAYKELLSIAEKVQQLS